MLTISFSSLLRWMHVKYALTSCGLCQAWEAVRGGALEAAAANNMLKYAMEVTGLETLDLPAFERLVAHFTED